MRIVCLGSAVSDSAIGVPGRVQQSGLQKPGIFDQVIGFFDRLSTIASTNQVADRVIKIEPAPVPMAAIIGVGIVGFLLIKAVK